MLYAVGVIEIKSIAKGVEACDEALKSAENAVETLTQAEALPLTETATEMLMQAEMLR